jgi:hypothetical protein
MRTFLGLLVVAIALTCTIFSCTDKELTEPPPPPAHCSNGQYDVGEQDIDCGGECGPCANLAAPCNPDTNSVTFDSSFVIPFPNTTLHTSNMTGTFDGSNYEAIVTSVAGDFYVKWHGDKPTQERTYKLGDTYYLNSFLNEGQATMKVLFSNGTKALCVGGKLYVKPLPNNKLLVTFCNARFADEQNPQTTVYNTTPGRFKING